MNILILGAGYVGSKAAALWTHKGHHVTVTTRRHQKLEFLSSVAQKCVIFKGDNLDELTSLLEHNDLIVTTVAPDNKNAYEETYLQLAKMIHQIAFEKNLSKSLIYTSSTAVYGEHHGQWVDESSELKNPTQTTRILIETENTYLSLADLGWKICLLRLSEIYGPGRELFRRAALSSAPNLADVYMNVVHVNDVVRALDYALTQKLHGIFNVASDDHPTRKELYQRIAEELNLPLPAQSSLRSTRGNKRISNHKLKEEGFQFSALDPFSKES